MLPGDTEQRSDLGLGTPRRGDDILAQQRAGMSRTTLRIAQCNIVGHLALLGIGPSVILFKIDAPRVPLLELEGDAPWTIDMHRISNWRKSLQRVIVEAGKVHLFRFDCDVHPIKSGEDACVQLRV